MRAIEQAQLLQRKAAQDLAVLRKLIGDPVISDETLGFHAQQAAEKMIKALLALEGHEYPRTHDLGLLLDLLSSLDVRIPEALLTVEILTPFATVFRYDELLQSQEKRPPSIDRSGCLFSWHWRSSSAGSSRRRTIRWIRHDPQRIHNSSIQ